MKTVVAFTGMPGSGKSTAGEFLENGGVRRLIMSDPIKEEMTSKGLELNNVTLRKYVLDMREKFGPNYAINLLKKKLIEEFKKTDVIILDGARNISEMQSLKNEGYNTIVVAIVTDRLVRFERIVERNAPTDFKTLKEFEWRDSQELNFGVDEVIATADFYIENNSGRNELERSLNALFGRIFRIS